MKLISYLHNLFIHTWHNASKESFNFHKKEENQKIDSKVIIILIYIAFSLSIVKYFGNPNYILQSINTLVLNLFKIEIEQLFIYSKKAEFYQRIWWISTILFFYLLIPFVIVRFIFKQKIKEFGFSTANIFKDYPIYLLMLATMLPIVYFASKTNSFQARYPIFKPVSGELFPLFFYWQVAYLIQFVAVEFFFRGFIIHGLKLRFGIYSIFISTIPYCMVHFGKPLGETLAAILAGIILGTLSLKSRSILLGIAIHYSVAITMDLFALFRQGIL